MPSSINLWNLVSMLTQGDAESNDVVVTVFEGNNIADIDKIFSDVKLIKSGDILKHSNIVSLEGYLFPDTYRFTRNYDAQSVDLILNKLQDNFKLKTADLIRYLSPEKRNHIVTVASMLEKEVRTEEDMMLVAGIIEKRLAADRPLELDATVSYGVCHQKFLMGKYCDVSLANIVDNIAVDSGYNTYKRVGLPAGPISNPGLKAIKAAMNPKASDYWYYLNARDGTTIFSKTAEEHIRARNKYLR